MSELELNADIPLAKMEKHICELIGQGFTRVEIKKKHHILNVYDYTNRICDKLGLETFQELKEELTVNAPEKKIPQSTRVIFHKNYDLRALANEHKRLPKIKSNLGIK